MKKALQIIVKGKVQGVFFRDSTKAVADQLGVKGIVKNLPNGDVFIEAELDPVFEQDFLEWCKTGPDEAEVTAIEVKETALKNFVNFVILKR
ncbi:acylphosphatase [Pedobacter glucosidilyticus]|uniref:acylphosphatase n=1 Tax=Pedobacter glucosidilyticus TaxID=1122941 RepID=UPI0004243FC9|nr:acylphosphatase [Pedobacter glucosidilyticus]